LVVQKYNNYSELPNKTGAIFKIFYLMKILDFFSLKSVPVSDYFCTFAHGIVFQNGKLFQAEGHESFPKWITRPKEKDR